MYHDLELDFDLATAVRQLKIFEHVNETHGGLKTSMTFWLSDKTQYTLDRLDVERRAAFVRMNNEKAEAGLRDVKLVDDW